MIWYVFHFVVVQALFAGPPVPSAISISGYLDKVTQHEWQKRKDNPLQFANEKEEDLKNLFRECPWDEVVITIKGKTISLMKEGDDEWMIVAPVIGGAEAYRVRAMTEAFATDTVLDPAHTVSRDELLVNFGLDAKHAIRVTMKQKGVPKVDLSVGAVKKRERLGDGRGRESYDTFVVTHGDAKQVYVARLKDLRTPFDLALAELRSKKVFNFDLDEITKVTIENPAEASAGKIVLAASWAEKNDAEKKEGEKDPATGEAKKPEKEGTFSLVEPQVPGFALMEMRSYWSSLAGIRVNEYVMEKPGPDTGLVGEAVAKAPKITIELADGKKQTLIFGAEKEPKKTYYAMLEGASEYMLVSDFTKNNLVKKLVELRDKNILGANDDADITSLKVTNEHTPDGPMVFERDGSGWKMTPPPAAQMTLGASLIPDDTELKELISALRYFRAKDFVSPAPNEEAVGLVKPAITVTATIKGVERTLSLGSAENDSKVYGRIDGTDLYFTVGSWSRDKFSKRPSDYKTK